MLIFCYLNAYLYLSLLNIVAITVFTCMSYNDKIERFTFKNLTY